MVYQKNAEKNIRIIDSFSPHGKQLRSEFVNKFKNPHQATSERFCWDYWNIKDQYRLLRTPASSFFKPTTYRAFLNQLLSFGRNHLGCQMISEPWISAYVEDCHQALHSDVPHGPFSFVYSLTPWANRIFTGGETLVSKPLLLNYFQNITHNQSHEYKHFIQKIDPKMNRLTVFDPRYPHGVASVKGATDLLNARVVIHGWFTEPRPMIEGHLSIKKISKPLDHFAYQLLDQIAPLNHYGLLTLKFTISNNGKIKNTKILTAHLINRECNILDQSTLKKVLKSTEVIFPKSTGETTITLPLEFKK